MKRKGEPRIVDPATHPKRYVSLKIAALYLEIDEKTLYKLLDNGLIEYVVIGRLRKIEPCELVAYETRQRVRRAG